MPLIISQSLRRLSGGDSVLPPDVVYTTTYGVSVSGYPTIVQGIN